MSPPLLILFSPPKRKLAFPAPIRFPDPPPRKAFAVVSPVILFVIPHKITPLTAIAVFLSPHKIKAFSPCATLLFPPPIKLVALPILVVPTDTVPDTIKTPERLPLA
jgi:hypothetical protein